MDAKGGADNMNTFVPSSDLIQEAECDTLLIYLPGFTKEQLRVQLSREGVLKVSGTRPIGNNKWSSFQKEFPVSPNCDRNKITAKYEGGILYIRQPKLIVPAEQKPQATSPQQSTPLPDQMPQTPPKLTPLPDQTPPKLTPLPDQMPQTPPKLTPLPDQMPQTPPKLTQEQGKTTPTDDKNMQRSDHKEPKAKVEEKSREPEAGKKEERKCEKDSISDHVDVNKGTYGRESVASGAKGDYKLKVDKLKAARKMTTMVMAVVFAYLIGLYVSRFIGKKAES